MGVNDIKSKFEGLYSQGSSYEAPAISESVFKSKCVLWVNKLSKKNRNLIIKA